jgi:hypothetical protein
MHHAYYYCHQLFQPPFIGLLVSRRPAQHLCTSMVPSFRPATREPMLLHQPVLHSPSPHCHLLIRHCTAMLHCRYRLYLSEFVPTAVRCCLPLHSVPFSFVIRPHAACLYHPMPLVLRLALRLRVLQICLICCFMATFRFCHPLYYAGIQWFARRIPQPRCSCGFCLM